MGEYLEAGTHYILAVTRKDFSWWSKNESEGAEKSEMREGAQHSIGSSRTQLMPAFHLCKPWREIKSSSSSSFNFMFQLWHKADHFDTGTKQNLCRWRDYFF